MENFKSAEQDITITERERERDEPSRRKSVALMSRDLKPSIVFLVSTSTFTPPPNFTYCDKEEAEEEEEDEVRGGAHGISLLFFFFVSLRFQALLSVDAQMITSSSWTPLCFFLFSFRFVSFCFVW